MQEHKEEKEESIYQPWSVFLDATENQYLANIILLHYK